MLRVSKRSSLSLYGNIHLFLNGAITEPSQTSWPPPSLSPPILLPSTVWERRTLELRSSLCLTVAGPSWSKGQPEPYYRWRESMPSVTPPGPRPAQQSPSPAVYCLRECLYKTLTTCHLQTHPCFQFPLPPWCHYESEEIKTHPQAGSLPNSVSRLSLSLSVSLRCLWCRLGRGVLPSVMVTNDTLSDSFLSG